VRSVGSTVLVSSVLKMRHEHFLYDGHKNLVKISTFDIYRRRASNLHYSDVRPSCDDMEISRLLGDSGCHHLNDSKWRRCDRQNVDRDLLDYTVRYLKTFYSNISPQISYQLHAYTSLWRTWRSHSLSQYLRSCFNSLLLPVQLHPVPALRISGTTPPYPQTPSWRTHSIFTLP
jgi:hypothetical protein